MSDEADMAGEKMEAEMMMALARHANAKRIQPTGFCLWCEEPAPEKALFCGIDCRQDHEQYERRRKAGG